MPKTLPDVGIRPIAENHPWNMLDLRWRSKHLGHAVPRELVQVANPGEIQPAAKKKWNPVQSTLDRDTGIDGYAAPGARHNGFCWQLIDDLDSSGLTARQRQLYERLA